MASVGVTQPTGTEPAGLRSDLRVSCRHPAFQARNLAHGLRSENRSPSLAAPAEYPPTTTAAVRPISLCASALALFALLQPVAQTQTIDLAVPYPPTTEPVVARMLEMADVGPDDDVVDLGSGAGV